MSEEFKVGDVVVCVDARRRNHADRVQYDFDLRKGDLYRVSWIGPAHDGVVVALVNGENIHTISEFPQFRGGWALRRFRKIDADVTSDFRDMLRKLPAKVQA